MNSSRTFALRSTALTTAAFVLLTIATQSQETAPVPASPPGGVSVQELDSQVRELRAIVEEMRSENAQSRAEMRELRQELQDTRKLLAPITAGIGNSGSTTNSAPTTEAAASEKTSLASPPALRLPPRPQLLRIWEAAFRNSKNPRSCWARKSTSNIKPKWKPPPSIGCGFPESF